MHHDIFLALIAAGPKVKIHHKAGLSCYKGLENVARVGLYCQAN